LSRRLGSGAAAASFNPVVAAATSQRCAVKGAVAVDAAALSRLQYIYQDRSLIIETSKEDAMEPETKEEDERCSITPSPEVASFSSFFMRVSFIVHNSIYVKYSEYIYIHT